MIRANTRGDGRIQAAAGPLAMVEAIAGTPAVAAETVVDQAGRLEAAVQAVVDLVGLLAVQAVLLAQVALQELAVLQVQVVLQEESTVA